MRKHDVRKWLHAILDLLPVILIPVFMIYSHRHEINDGSIQIQQKLVVDFNQQVQNGNFADNSYWRASNSSLSIVDNVAIVTPNGNVQFPQIIQNIDAVLGHQYILRLTYNAVNGIGVNFNGNNFSFVSSNELVTRSFKFDVVDINNNLLLLYSLNATNDFYLTNINLFDLTQLYGVGNEPTIAEFDVQYPNDYYAFVLTDKELIDGDLVTLNDTDIMSQFSYQLYNSVDKYFNMGNVFHLNEVYDWFNLNIFNGQAPIYIFIVYQIVLYELIMDLLMLLYALFMWFIDMIEKLMDKPLNSIK